MPFSAYVDSYPYPITAYIVGHLGLSVGDFCRRYEFDPTIVSGSSPLYFTLVRKATFRLSCDKSSLEHNIVFTRPPGFFTKYVKRRSLICQRFSDQT
ncbi:hypothetical protein [Enterococcus gallinarum]|uniref:hypothetical protein n=1 Tax=Enterococcus gallinarum TaxID=1353 RepID=UPI002433572B|nr:hypothetical protein [Enterococcus gallinarum]